MDLEVLKFGGSSLATAEALQRVQSVLLERRAEQKIVVCSAMGGATSALLTAGRLAESGDAGYRESFASIGRRHEQVIEALALPSHLKLPLISEVEVTLKEAEALLRGVHILGELSPRSADAIASCGERLAVPMVAALLRAGGLRVRRVDARDWIQTDDQHGAASVDWTQTSAAILTGVDADLAFDVLITEGYIGRGPDGATTTLGRGGSDYTASLIARATNARRMEKSTDVLGMMTADPRLVPEAEVIASMSYEEALELCHFGAKVIYHPTIEPLRKSGIPLIVRSTFATDNHPGTAIVASPEHTCIVRGLSSMSDMALITLVGGGIIAKPGFSRRVFTALAQAAINVVLITQSSSEHTITLAIAEGDVPDAERALTEEFEADMTLGRLESIRIDQGLSIVALVGGGMQSAAGVSGQAFEALGRAGINVRAIAQGSTERNISIVLSSIDVPAALRAMHQAFFSNIVQEHRLLCFGTGQVGRAFLDQIHAAAPTLRQRGISIQVVGIVRRQRHLLDPEGIDLGQWSEQLDAAGQGHASTQEIWSHILSSPSLRPTILVDNTASEDTTALYLEAAKARMHLVASNKLAAAGPLDAWLTLNKQLKAAQRSFRHETNVGAALPVLDALAQMVATGDEVLRIEAVLSGSLNFIFSRIQSGQRFSEAVQEARELGYTEPDPRLDLSGEDVVRKILICARACGASLDMKDVHNPGFLPKTAFAGEAGQFMASLADHDSLFVSQDAGVWRFVARFAPGQCAVGLERLPIDHPFAQLQGPDNQIRIHSRRYSTQPLVLQGSGAGAVLTASGVFSDVLRLTAQPPMS